MTAQEKLKGERRLTSPEKERLNAERAHLQKVRQEYIEAYRHGNREEVINTPQKEDAFIAKNQKNAKGRYLLTTKLAYQDTKKKFRAFLHDLFSDDIAYAEFKYAEELSEELKLKKTALILKSLAS